MSTSSPSLRPTSPPRGRRLDPLTPKTKSYIFRNCQLILILARARTLTLANLLQTKCGSCVMFQVQVENNGGSSTAFCSLCPPPKQRQFHFNGIMKEVLTISA